MSSRGMLITFEGNEGCGKSTQLRLLYDYLRKKGKKVFLTREPGGTPIGDRIRGVLLDVRHQKMSPVCETLLYMASRAQLVAEVVKPRLDQGQMVLCDRWLDSTLAYQGYAGGVDPRWIQELGRAATQGVMPNLTIYLDLPVKDGLERVRKRNASDRMEKKGLIFHEKVRKGFLAIAKKEPKRFKRIVVSKNDSIQEVHEKILKAFRREIGYTYLFLFQK